MWIASREILKSRFGGVLRCWLGHELKWSKINLHILCLLRIQFSILYSKKQHITFRSLIKVVYMSLTSVVANISWLYSLLSELKIIASKTSIVWHDNLHTIIQVANRILHARTKHIELDFYFVHEFFFKKKI